MFYNPKNCAIEIQDVGVQMELCDLQADQSLPDLEDKMIFWKNVSKLQYPKLTTSILRCLSMFSTSYLCESIYSAMKNIKSLKRNRLSDKNLENLLRVALVDYELDFDDIIKS